MQLVLRQDVSELPQHDTPTIQWISYCGRRAPSMGPYLLERELKYVPRFRSWFIMVNGVMKLNGGFQLTAAV